MLGQRLRLSDEHIRTLVGAGAAAGIAAAFNWPRDCVIAAVRRGSRLLIPRGDTVLLPGDVLTIVSEQDSVPALRRLCTAQVPDEEPVERATPATQAKR